MTEQDIIGSSALATLILIAPVIDYFFKKAKGAASDSPQTKETIMSEDNNQAVLNAFARAAYEAYGIEVGGKAFDGSPLKSFDELPENIRAGWEASAARVVELVSEDADQDGDDSDDGTASDEVGQTDTAKAA